MKISTTNRGFTIHDFKDSKGVQCSIQESSACATNDGAYLWVGCDSTTISIFHPNQTPSWVDRDPTEMAQMLWPEVPYTVSNNRMHLSREDIKAMLPSLEYFVKHGVLPE